MVAVYESVPPSGKRQKTARSDMRASAAVIYAALAEVPQDEVAAWAGVTVGRMRTVASYAGLPARKQKIVDTWQAAVVSAALTKEQVRAFNGIGKLSELLENVSENVNELAKEVGNAEIPLKTRVRYLGDLTKAVEAISKLSAPLAFLYRDSLDKNLDTRITRLMEKEWSKELARNLMELALPSPMLAETPREPSQRPQAKAARRRRNPASASS